MEKLLEAYKNKKPQIVFEWQDLETEAEGWAVINSLRNGAAGGGTRMRKGLNKEEVISLSKVMEIKFSISGPPIGGAKSGINFDPNDPRKDEVLKRWFAAVISLLKNYYGTGGDLNVDELKDVIPITEDLGLWHPQEGIVNGHFKPRQADKIHMIGQLRQGVSKVLEDPIYSPNLSRKYTVADMITGYGVCESVKHYYDLYHQEKLEGKTAIIQGWGNVAGAAAFYLSQYGVKIVGIIDRAGGILAPEGLSFEKIKTLFDQREGNKLTAENLMPFDEINKVIWDQPADIFMPGAASRLVNKDQVDRLHKGGLKVISCGANVPFKDSDVFYGETAQYVDSICSLIPDFIANCGMARVFAYLMHINNEISDEAIFGDVSNIIKEALIKTKAVHKEDTLITQTALSNCLKILFDQE